MSQKRGQFLLVRSKQNYKNLDNAMHNPAGSCHHPFYYPIRISRVKSLTFLGQNRKSLLQDRLAGIPGKALYFSR